jgi:oligopeptidase B
MKSLRIVVFAVLSVSCLGARVAMGIEGHEMKEPPVAKVVPERLEKHGDVRVDNYYWLREREEPDVLAYLKAENAYTDAMEAHTAPLEGALFEEIKGRIKQTDLSVPYKEDGYFYYIRFEEGSEYPFYCRKKGTLDGPEEMMLDANALAEGHAYFSVSERAVSSGRDILAYAVDSVGRRIYTINFKNLTTGEMFEDTIPDVTGNMAWANDNKTLFYARQDLTTLRSNRIYCHVLGSDPSKDRLVFEEQDETFTFDADWINI